MSSCYDYKGDRVPGRVLVMSLLAGDIADDQPRFASNSGMFRWKSLCVLLLPSQKHQDVQMMILVFWNVDKNPIIFNAACPQRCEVGEGTAATVPVALIGRILYCTLHVHQLDCTIANTGSCFAAIACSATLVRLYVRCPGTPGGTQTS